MNKTRLMNVLNQSTCLISNGERTQRKLPGIPVLLWGLLLSQQDPMAEQLYRVDCFYVTVGVNTVEAESAREEFIALLEEFPDHEKLQGGPSYKHIASVVGDDITALRVFGLGQTLGLWDVVLPDQLGVDPELVEEAADLGAIVTTGYRSRASEEAPLVAFG